VATITRRPGRKNYTIEYIDEDGKRRRKSGGHFRKTAEQIANHLEHQAFLRRNGLEKDADDPHVITKWRIKTLLSRSPAAPKYDAPQFTPRDLEPYEDRLIQLPGPVPPGVYFLLRNCVVVYVGRTADLHARISAHCEDKEFDRVLFLCVAADDLDEVESSFIRMMRPKYNIQGIDGVCANPRTPRALPVALPADPHKAVVDALWGRLPAAVKAAVAAMVQAAAKDP
jgi:hypothetical protein